MTGDQQLVEDLRELQRALVADLLSRVKSGEADAKELAVALKALKDNGITLMPVREPQELVGYKIEPALLPEFPRDGED